MKITHTIIIPTYNRPQKLKRAVTSAITAAGETGEVIVVDDASDVPAEQALCDINFERLRHFRNVRPMSGGGSPSRNVGAQNAQGDVLFFLDDDDEFVEGYCASILSDDVQRVADFGFSARMFVDADADADKTSTRTETRDLTTGPVPLAADFREKTFPFSAGFWLKNMSYEGVGPMETGLRTNSDTEYTCRLYASALKGWYSADPGVRIYEHAESSSGETLNITKRANSEDRARAFGQIAQKHTAFLERDPSAGRFVYSRLAKHAARAGQTRNTLSALQKITPWTARFKANCHTLPLLVKASLRS